MAELADALDLGSSPHKAVGGSTPPFRKDLTNFIGGKMKVEILYKPSYSMAKVGLESSERITVEAGSMVAMSNDIQVETVPEKGVICIYSKEKELVAVAQPGSAQTLHPVKVFM